MSADSPPDTNPEAPLWILTSDSVYRLHPAIKTIDRVTGVRPPTPRQGTDGEAQAYTSLYIGHDPAPSSAASIPLVGHGFVIDWDGAGRATFVSSVTAVSDRPLWGRSFWLEDPANVPDGRGAVVSAGNFVAASPTVETAFLIAALLTGSTELASGAAIGVAASAHADGRQWSAFDDPNPVLAPVREDGWRRPWDIPAGILVS